MGDMDSGNSGSMQSSSTGGGGGDEQEYESQGGESSFPLNFFNNQEVVNYQVAPFDSARLLQLYSLSSNGSSSSHGIFVNQQQQQQHGQLNFGSLESANFNNSNTSNTNLDSLMWANRFGSIRSQSDDHATNCTTTAATTSTTGGYNNHLQPHHPLGPPPPPVPSGGASSENSPRSSNQNASVGGVSSGGGLGRNPKKRSRASRRAPTTVLTTDTSNFRQMVQEFTGIPAPPFSASGFPSRSRLDLFGGIGMGMGMGIGMGTRIGSGLTNLPRTGGGSTNSMDPPSYLLRPFAQKILPHPSPLLNPQQQRDSGSTTTTTSTNANALTNAVGANAGTIPPAAFQLQPPNNPMLSFQSLLQQSSSSLIQPGAGPLGTGGGDNEQRNWGGLHQGMGFTQEAAHDRLLSGPGKENMSVGTHSNNTERVGAINSTSDNHGGGVIRGERGMVDSWICSSD